MTRSGVGPLSGNLRLKSDAIRFIASESDAMYRASGLGLGLKSDTVEFRA